MAASHGQKSSRKSLPFASRRPAMAVAAFPLDEVSPRQFISDVRNWRDELAAQQSQIQQQVDALDRLLAACGSGSAGSARGGMRAGRPAGRKGRRGAVAQAPRMAPSARTRSADEDARRGSLRWHIARVVRAAGRPLRVAEVTSAVLRGGYRSRNQTLAKSVGITLAGMPSVEKVGHGTYRAK